MIETVSIDALLQTCKVACKLVSIWNICINEIVDESKVIFNLLKYSCIFLLICILLCLFIIIFDREIFQAVKFQ